MASARKQADGCRRGRVMLHSAGRHALEASKQWARRTSRWERTMRPSSTRGQAPGAPQALRTSPCPSPRSCLTALREHTAGAAELACRRLVRLTNVPCQASAALSADVFLCVCVLSVVLLSALCNWRAQLRSWDRRRLCRRMLCRHEALHQWGFAQCVSSVGLGTLLATIELRRGLASVLRCCLLLQRVVCWTEDCIMASTHRCCDILCFQDG